MRILHLAPLWWPVARDAPGGIETYLATLIGALNKLGCQSTLAATGDSDPGCELLPVTERALWSEMEDERAWEYDYYHQHQLAVVLERARDFDLVHSNLGGGAFAISSAPGLVEPVLHTQHNSVTPDMCWFVGRHPDTWLSTVSEPQARRLRASGARRCEVVPNGIRFDDFVFSANPGHGVLFIGRIEWEKGTDAAARAARAAGRPLTIAGPIVDGSWFQSAVEPHLGDGSEYVGVADHAQKVELYGAAGCLMMPSRWEEPFGLVAVESMACGTPVVALANGALPDIIENGVTGYVAASEEELPRLVRSALALDRERVRKRAIARFDVAAAAERYLDLYERIIATARAPAAVSQS